MAVTTLTLWNTVNVAALPGSTEWAAAVAGWPAAFNGNTGDVATAAVNHGLSIAASLVNTGVLTSDVITSVVLKFDWAIVDSNPLGGFAYQTQPGIAAEFGPFYGTTSGSHAEEILGWYTGGPSITRDMLFNLESASPHYWALVLTSRFNGSFAPFTTRITISNVRIEVTDDAPSTTVTRVVASQGRTTGGRRVRIEGTGFTGTPGVVTFGGTPATDVRVVSDTRIMARTPAHAAGAVAVAVDGVVLADGFRYTDTMFGDLTIREKPGITIDDALGDAAKAAAVTCDGVTVPALGAGTRIVDPASGALLFGGTALVATSGMDATPDTPGHRALSCGGLGWRFNARRPVGTWTDAPANGVAQALVDAFAPQFTLVVEAGLPAISLTCDRSQPLTEIFATIARLIGGSYTVDDDALVVRLFRTDTGDPPDPITDDTPLYDPPPTVTTDLTQVRNRIYVSGAGGATSFVPPVSVPPWAVGLYSSPAGVVTPVAGGLIPNGIYGYFMSYTTAFGETHPTPLTSYGAEFVMPGGLHAFQLAHLDQSVHPDPRVTGRRLWRTRSAGSTWQTGNFHAAFLVTAFGNTAGLGDDTYLDTKADADLTVPPPTTNTTGSVFVMVEDPVAQAWLAARLNVDGGDDDGIREGSVTDPTLTTATMATVRGNAELTLWAYGTQTVVVAARDPKLKSGRMLPITLTNPAVSGIFKIEHVHIDQVAIDGEKGVLFPRFTVTAGPRFTLDDLLRGVVLGGGGGGGAGGGASSSSSGGSGGGLPPPAVPAYLGEVPSGAIDEINALFTLAHVAGPGTLAIYLNGMRQLEGQDYTITTSSSFTMLAAPRPGDRLVVDYQGY